MKRLFLSVIAMMTIFAAYAESASNASNMALAVVIEDPSGVIPEPANKQLQNRLIQMLTQNGVSSSDYFGQFFLAAFAIPQEKDVLPGPPQQYLQTMEINLYIADYTNKVIFASTSLTAKGAGQNEARSCMDAMRKMPIQSANARKFVEEAKTKIINYYNTEADNILTRAKSLMKMKQYEEAIFLANSIPAQCAKYTEAQEMCMTIYQMYVDNLCTQNLALARSAWMAEQNATGAYAAGEYLSQILPDAACYDDAMALYKEIKGKVLDDWKFEMKQYQDGVDLESQRINAMREVGVAFGKGQQPTTTNIGFLRGL